MDNGEGGYLRFLSGDDEGIISVVEEYKDSLILFLTGFVGNAETAEELAEDTFFRLIVKKPRFGGKSSFKTWLYAIARNVAVDYIRKHRCLSVSIDDIDGFISDTRSLEETCIKSEMNTAVHRAMLKLNPDYRQVLWLSYFEMLSNAEISRILKKSNRQTVNLLYNAKKSLKAELAREGFSYEEYR